MTIVAAIQMTSTPVVEENITTVQRLVGDAVAAGAELALLPEYWAIIGMHEKDKLAQAEQFGEGAMQNCLRELAKQHGICLIGGTIPLQSPEASKVLNTTLVFDPQGACVARYDKMHLFGFQKGSESYDESRTILHGDRVGYFAAPFGRVGLSVCYDLRFPELYRALGDCALIVVPSAFTDTTGQAHWEVLLRARAIENQCYVLAAAQGGVHRNGRRTWGHSMLIDPWGEVLSVLPAGEGVVSGVLDTARLAAVRASLPALQHRRL
ncbi:MAG: carbon-nitrogen hydrolase family protein [Cellvibrionales bacterium]|jgi:predicted amidohydrolase|nr:carbon-nitrogen hydrolase family protein [Cellvibrionales bacterium]